MKYNATKKDMKRYDKIIGTGADNLQHLLKFHDPIAYSTRAEGWSCDYYDIDGVLISTGYAPLDSKRTFANYALIHEYDEKARDINANNEIEYDDKKAMVNELLSEFITKATTKEA